MVADLERRLVELRFLDGVEKVEHVPYQTGDQFWVRFNKPLDSERLQKVLKKHGYSMAKFANIPSKLPKKLAEVLWNGVTLVIAKNISGWSKFKASLGFEPEGIAKIATDLHGPYQIFITTDEAGIQVLYEYLELKYVPPSPPPPKPATPAKPVAPAVARPSPPPGVQRPAVPVSTPPAVAEPPPPSQPQQTKPVPQPQPVAAAPPVKTADSTQTQAKKETTTQTTV